MGLFQARFRFPGEPPSRERIDRELVARLGEDEELSTYRREGNEIVIGTSIVGVMPDYAIKVLRDLGGTLLNPGTREPWDEPLPAFVDKAWLEHDEATRRAILLELERELERRGR